jgi:uncharacterized repeat protein (TIGR01451 family)
MGKSPVFVFRKVLAYHDRLALGFLGSSKAAVKTEENPMKYSTDAPRRGVRSRHSRKAGAVLSAGLAVALLCGAGLVSAAIDKDATYQEMIGLAQQMQGLKPQIRTNGQAATAYTTAERRYRELSAAMGGDDPGRMVSGSPTVAPSRRSPDKIVKGVSPGCGQATANYTQSTPVAIPSGPEVVTSTIVVSGAGPYLFDLNVTTGISHTFSADLDVTITSPAGTVVTLTTDNGGTNDDVFNGTLWDDDANPGGQVPYVTNDGLVTDQVYANLTLASPLVPEEALGAFVGEDPNGTWTLTISDDLAGDGGNLNNWSLAVTSLAAAPTTTTVPRVTQSTPVEIPTGPAVVTSTLVVSGAGTAILDVNALTHLQHTFSADLDVTLTSPAGTVVTLTTDNAGTNDDVFNGTLWDDDANPGGQVPYVTNDGVTTDQLYANLTLASPLVPEEAMAAFIGEDPNGTWTLTISDDLAGDGGNLVDWSLDLTTFSCAAPASVDLSLTKTLTTGGVVHVGDNVTFALAVTNNGPSAATGVTVTDTLPAGLTYVSNSCGATFASPTLTWNVGALAASASATCNLTATVTQVGTITNTASATANETDPTPANNAATGAVTAVAPEPASVIPTLDTLGLGALAILLATSAAFFLRRKRQA